MSSRPVCRLCLAMNAPMHNIADSPLQTVYEKLTNISLHAAPRPVAACYLCYSQLRKCHNLMVRSLKADKVLTQLLQSGELVNLDLITVKKREIQELNELVVTSLQLIAIEGPGHSPSNINIKEEPLSPQCKEEVDTDRLRCINYLTFEDSENEENFARVIGRDVESIENKGSMDREEINKQLQNTAYLEIDIFPASVDIKQEKLEEIQTHVRGCTVGLKFESEDDNNRNELTFEGGTKHKQPLSSQRQKLMKTDRRRCIDDLKFKDSEHEEDMDRLTQTDVTNIVNEDFTDDKEMEDEESEENVDVESVEAAGAAPAEKCKKTHAGKIQDGSTLTPGTKNILEKPTRSTVVEEATSRNIGRHLLRGTKTANNRQASVNSYSDTAIYKSNISIGSDNDDCGNVFVEKHLIERIVAVKKTSHPKSGRHFECEICRRTFNRKAGLKVHSSIHTGEKRYECEICKVRFIRKDVLKLHLRIHTGEKPYECEICKVKFSQKGSLKKHLRIHPGGKIIRPGEKPYECELCRLRFVSKSNLKNHLKIHTGEKAYECEICKVRFTRKDYLKKHLSIHTGDKPYECELCKLRFRSKSNLNYHLRIHTGENP